MGCNRCDDGYFEVATCPNVYARECFPAIPLIDLYLKGLPPVHGGSLDQSQWFVDAANILSREDQLAGAV